MKCEVCNNLLEKEYLTCFLCGYDNSIVFIKPENKIHKSISAKKKIYTDIYASLQRLAEVEKKNSVLKDEIELNLTEYTKIEKVNQKLSNKLDLANKSNEKDKETINKLMHNNHELKKNPFGSETTSGSVFKSVRFKIESISKDEIKISQKFIPSYTIPEKVRICLTYKKGEPLNSIFDGEFCLIIDVVLVPGRNTISKAIRLINGLKGNYFIEVFAISNELMVTNESHELKI